MSKKSQPVSILLVDDDINIRFAIKKFLTHCFKVNEINLKLFTAQDGVEGLGLIYAANPTVAIIDSTLPRYGGKEIVDYLKDNEKYHKMPVIVLLDNGKTLELPQNFIQISKKNTNFINILLDEIGKATNIKMSLDNKGNSKTLSAKTIFFSSKASNIYKKLTKANILVKPFYYLYYSFLQFVTSTFLRALFFKQGKKIDEETLDQYKKDQATLRTRKSLPTLSN